MTKPLSKAMLMLVAIALAACQGIPSSSNKVGVGMTGIDHLADHLSVQDYWVDNHAGFQAGKGGSNVCCASVPATWSPDARIEVRWEVANWRTGTWRCYRRMVSIEPYTKIGRLYVHFLPDGSVKAVLSNEAPWSPTYDGPRTPIPRKEPWKQFPQPPVTQDCPENLEL